MASRKETLYAAHGQRAGRHRLRKMIDAYNRMSAENQGLIRAAGAQDLYLRGAVSLADVQRGARRRRRLGLKPFPW